MPNREKTHVIWGETNFVTQIPDPFTVRWCQTCLQCAQISQAQRWKGGKTNIFRLGQLSVGDLFHLPPFPQGTGCEMYTETLSSSFIGMSFSRAAEICFVKVNIYIYIDYRLTNYFSAEIVDNSHRTEKLRREDRDRCEPSESPDCQWDCGVSRVTLNQGLIKVIYLKKSWNVSDTQKQMHKNLTVEIDLGKESKKTCFIHFFVCAGKPWKVNSISALVNIQRILSET